MSFLPREILFGLRRLLVPLVALGALACAAAKPHLIVKAPVPSTISPTERSVRHFSPVRIEQGDDPFKILFGKPDEPAREHVKPVPVPGEDYVPHLKLTSEVDEKTVKDLVQDIGWANDDGAAEIVIEFDTPGGSVSEGRTLSKAIEGSKAPVTCVVDGMGASMGFYIFESCAHRYMLARSTLMGHEPAIGGFVIGQPGLWRNVWQHLKTESRAMAEHITHRARMRCRDYLARISNGQELWLDHEDAWAWGFTDGTAPSVKEVLEHYRQRKGEPLNVDGELPQYPATAP